MGDVNYEKWLRFEDAGSILSGLPLFSLLERHSLEHGLEIYCSVGNINSDMKLYFLVAG